jgi:hypothetical protein
MSLLANIRWPNTVSNIGEILKGIPGNPQNFPKFVIIA